MNFSKFKGYWHTLEHHEETSLVKTRVCDAPGCTNRGEYRAPKSRYNLNDYYWFCLEHVREYNQQWDFFEGMSDSEIEEHINKNMVGDRPTWRSTEAGLNEERLKENIRNTMRNKAHIFQDFTFNGESTDSEENEFSNIKNIPNTTLEALKVMELAPPIEWDEIKSKYKELVKKYHPDRNKGCEVSEEKLKQINLAYSILKIAHQAYTNLDRTK